MWTIFFSSYQIHNLSFTFSKWENYIVFREYIKCVFPLLTEVVGPIMNLINETHDLYEKRKYTSNILLKYNIIILSKYAFVLTLSNYGISKKKCDTYDNSELKKRNTMKTSWEKKKWQMRQGMRATNIVS